MLRIIKVLKSGYIPGSYFINKDVSYQPGRIVSLKIKNDIPVLDMSNGLETCGIVDEFYSNSLRRTKYNQLIKFIDLPVKHLPNDLVILEKKLTQELNDTNLIAHSCDLVGVVVNYKIGTLVLPKGLIIPTSRILYDSEHKPYIDLILSYGFNIPKLTSNSCEEYNATVWNTPMIAQTDQFDIYPKYEKYDPLYIDNGFLTTNKKSEYHGSIGFVMEPPNYVDNPSLEFYWNRSDE